MKTRYETTLDDITAARVWNHAELTALKPGTPVALHALYNVLAIGTARFNVVVAPRITPIRTLLK